MKIARHARARAVRVRTFDARKAIEAILFVASKLRDPTFHKISKLLYFADRIHLERYGRLICGDDYYAMQHGPVPSRVYDMLKAVVGRGESPWSDEARKALKAVGDHTVKPQRAPDLNALSKSEIESMERAIAEHGRKSFSALTAASHDEAWKAVDENDLISVEDIARTLPNAEEVLEHLRA